MSDTKWHFMENNKPQGPVSENEIIALMQEQRISDLSLVWSPDLEDWMPLCDVENFNRDRIAILHQDVKNALGFKKRKNDRKTVDQRLIGHNRQVFFVGKTHSISSQGALIEVDSTLLFPNDPLILHIEQKVLLAASVKQKLFRRGTLRATSKTQYIVGFDTELNLKNLKIKTA